MVSSFHMAIDVIFDNELSLTMILFSVCFWLIGSQALTQYMMHSIKHFVEKEESKKK